MTLKKADLQNFFKRLRKALPPDTVVKYYAVGEYGTKNNRPHYHAIVFGVPDTKYFVDAWTLGGDQVGGVHIGQVSGDSIAYTMKYIDKSSFRAKHGRDDRIPEFPLMSKGLGKNYLTPQIEAYHKADLSRLYATKPGGHRIALPRYYREKIYSDHEKTQQRFIVQSAVDQSLSEKRSKWESLYVNNDGTFDLSFEAWQESARQGRYKNFYTNQKTRDV